MPGLLDAYRQNIGDPFAQLVGGAGRGFLGLGVPAYAGSMGMDAYRTGQALSNMPGLGAPAGLLKAAANAPDALVAMGGLLGKSVGKLAANAPSGSSLMTDRVRPTIRYGEDRAEEYLDFLRQLKNKEIAFHQSANPNLTRIEAAGGMSNPNSKFGGLFGGSLDNVMSYGYGGSNPTLYELSVLRKDIAEPRDLRSIQNAPAVLRAFADPAYKSKLRGSKVDDLYDVVTRESSADEIDDLRKMLGVKGYLADEFNWDMQRLRGALARSAGYKAVTTDDEIGSTLFLPGATLKKSIIQPK
jgi:hypothetical protein